MAAGGELQRFAIAVVAAQDADVYMIDEPSSYLDVRQRLKAGEVYPLLHCMLTGYCDCGVKCCRYGPGVPYLYSMPMHVAVDERMCLECSGGLCYQPYPTSPQVVPLRRHDAAQNEIQNP